jgi:hypothetical protein
MTGTLLHYGRDACHRVPVLEGAGFRVTGCRSAIQLRAILQRSTFADAVVFTEGFHAWAEASALISSLRCPIPSILFEETNRRGPRSNFDLVIPSHVAPAQWLGDIEDLVAKFRANRIRSGELMARSAALTREAKRIVERSRHERGRSQREYATGVPEVLRNWAAAGIGENALSGPVQCSERNQLDTMILLSLARLTQILQRMIRESLQSGEAASAPMQSLKVEHHLECATMEALLIQWKTHKRRHKC